MLFCDEGLQFLESASYYVTKENRSTLRNFFRRIFQEIHVNREVLPNNRICTILNGSRQCGKTLLVKLTMKFLKDFDHVNSVFAECNVIECGRQNGSRSLLFGLLRATL